MIKPLPLYIGLRYTRAKRRTGFISFISLASTLGVALGVMVLITVLSVMNGFDEKIRQHFFALTPQVTAATEQNTDGDWRQWLQAAEQIHGVGVGAPFVSSEGMLVKRNALQAVVVMGILPAAEIQVFDINPAITQGNINDLTADSFNVIIPQDLARQWRLQVGDAVNILTSQATTTPLGLFPRYRRFTVSGVYDNSGVSVAEQQVYIAIDDARKLFAAGRYTNGLHLKVADVYRAPQFARHIQRVLPKDITVTDWTVESGAFFQALAMEKVMMFILLLFIIAIGAFNLISMLMMVVNEKQADIAILRTLGATPQTIRHIFITQGAVLGVLGTLAGLIGGLLLTWQITPVVNALQQFFHVQFIPSGMFWSNILPTKILWWDVALVCVIALGLSVLATLYPAAVAFRIQPAEALRYE